jgi:hypothetical protein
MPRHVPLMLSFDFTTLVSILILDVLELLVFGMFALAISTQQIVKPLGSKKQYLAAGE